MVMFSCARCCSCRHSMSIGVSGCVRACIRGLFAVPPSCESGCKLDGIGKGVVCAYVHDGACVCEGCRDVQNQRMLHSVVCRSLASVKHLGSILCFAVTLPACAAMLAVSFALQPLLRQPPRPIRNPHGHPKQQRHNNTGHARCQPLLPRRRPLTPPLQPHVQLHL